MRAIALLAIAALATGLAAPVAAFAASTRVEPGLERWARQFVLVLKAPGGVRPAEADARSFVPWLAEVTGVRAATRAWTPRARGGEGLRWRVRLPEGTTRAARDAWLARLREQRPWRATGWEVEIIEDGPIWTARALDTPRTSARAKEWAITGR